MKLLPAPSAVRRARVFAFLPAFLAASVLAQNAYVNFEGKQTQPVRLSPDGTRLFAVNTPDNRLSVFDVSNPVNPILIAEIPVGLEPVSVNPVSNDEAWVVSEVSDSVSIVSVSRHLVMDTLYVKDEPADVVFANGRAFVTLSRNNQIAVFNLTNHTVVTNISLFGENPRALAVSLNGSNVYAAFALSGNRTTLVPPNLAPGQLTNGTPPMNPALSPPPQVGLIVDAADPAWNPSVVKYTMPDNDVVEINSTTLAITRYFPRVGTVNLGLAVQPVSGNLYVANQDARNLTHFEPALRSAFVTNQISRINITNGAVTRYDLNPGFNYTTFPSLPDKTNALAQPTALVFGPSGANFFVAAFGSDRVALVDANNGSVLARIELCPTAPGSAADPRNKRGPRGLALKPGSALYVLNRISNTITVIDPVTRTVLREIPIGSFDPTPATVRAGRGFLYDAKLSGNGTVSCASCHIDAEMDFLAWDLGDPLGTQDTVNAVISGSRLLLPVVGISSNFVMHPMKGPMTTQTLRGLAGLDPLHWRGDRTNFTHFNGAFDALLGGTVLAAADMQAYRDFINTIKFQANPNQNLDRTLTNNFKGANPIAGRNTYMNTDYQSAGPGLGLKCVTCHALPNGTDKSLTPAAALQESQSFKVPQLRNVYQKMAFTNAPGAQSISGFGLVHDGMDPSLFIFLSRPVFGVFATDAVVKSNLSAFVQCFDTGTAPAVGYGRTVTVTNVLTAAMTNDWTLLESQAAALTNIDLIVKGTIDGQQRGLLYQPGPGNYATDKTGVGPFTRAQLIAKILAGDTLNLLGAPAGSGVRLAVRRNPAAVLDGDVPRPMLQIARSSGNALVSWATNDTGFFLETGSPVNGTNWSTETSLRGVISNRFAVTNSLSLSNRFYRMKGL